MTRKRTTEPTAEEESHLDALWTTAFKQAMDTLALLSPEELTAGVALFGKAGSDVAAEGLPNNGITEKRI